jgi:hypothetical protein
LEAIWGDDPGKRFVCTDSDFRGKLFDNNEEAAAFVTAEDAQGKNVFFGVHLFNDKGRKAENAIGSRALFLDIDCGKSKAYSDKSSALEAVQKFLEIGGLPGRQ